jgi:hypothetical protein
MKGKSQMASLEERVNALTRRVNELEVKMARTETEFRTKRAAKVTAELEDERRKSAVAVDDALDAAAKRVRRYMSGSFSQGSIDGVIQTLLGGVVRPASVRLRSEDVAEFGDEDTHMSPAHNLWRCQHRLCRAEAAKHKSERWIPGEPHS